MLKGLSRIIAVLLVAVALPLQGLAAVTAGQCMSFGHHEHSAGYENHGQEHGQPSDGAVAHDHAAHSHDDAKDGGTATHSAHCGACTACCASASIAGRASLSIPSSPAAAEYVFSQLPPPGFQPDGLDRPPLAL
jgi:hypothetical protein